MLDFEKRLYEVADGEELVSYSTECIKAMFEEDMIRILTEKGIPRFWTPDVDFIREERGAFQKMSNYIKDISDREVRNRFEKFKNYIVFAMHNNNFITLNEKKEVVMVDTEKCMETYVQRDIKSFVYSLVIFNEIVLRIIDEFPECDYYAEYIEEEDIENFKKVIAVFDETAIKEGTFWDIVLEEIFEEQ